MKQMQIYYAHSRQLYDSVREMNEHALIYDYYSPAKIINPAHLKFSGMKKYLEVVSQCDILVASEYEGFVGRGVLVEILHAISLDKKVRVLRKEGKEYKLYHVIGYQIENENDWKVKYAKLIIK